MTSARVQCDGLVTCAAAKFDGVICPDDTCDFDTGVRKPPHVPAAPSPSRSPAATANEIYRETARRVAEAREKKLAETVADNARLRSELEQARGMVIEQCAKIADPWPFFNVGQKISEPDLSVIQVREKIATAIRSLAVTSTERQGA